MAYGAPKGYKAGRMANMTKKQMSLLNRNIDALGPNNYLSKLAAGDEETFEEMEAPALKQFAGVQGNIASRFSGMGTGGRKSSGFQSDMNTAASNFLEQLQSRRGELRRQAMKDMNEMSSNLLGQRPYENYLVKKAEKQSNGWGGLAGAIVGGGAGLALSSGNPMVGLEGAGMGYKVGSAFD